MSDPTSSQKIRSEAVDQVIKLAAGHVLTADDVVRAADTIAQFVINGTTPPKPEPARPSA